MRVLQGKQIIEIGLRSNVRGSSVKRISHYNPKFKLTWISPILVDSAALSRSDFSYLGFYPCVFLIPVFPPQVFLILVFHLQVFLIPVFHPQVFLIPGFHTCVFLTRGFYLDLARLFFIILDSKCLLSASMVYLYLSPAMFFSKLNCFTTLFYPRLGMLCHTTDL